MRGEISSYLFISLLSYTGGIWLLIYTYIKDFDKIYNMGVDNIAYILDKILTLHAHTLNIR